MEATEAIQAMETWNADLAWFIFQRERVHVLEIIGRGRAGPRSSRETKPKPVGGGDGSGAVALGEGRLRFAKVVF